MLRWTPRGAVSLPTTLQIRLEQAYPGRIRAGAPVPSRSLTPSELQHNLRHFTEGQQGPRTRPCSGLVLSGAGVVQRPDLPEALSLARRLGMKRVVAHLEVDDLHGAGLAALPSLDRLVLPVRGSIGPLRAALEGPLAGRDVVVHAILEPSLLPLAKELLACLLAARPAGVAWTFPYPGTPGPWLRPDEAVASISPVLDRLEAAKVPSWVNGLPACLLGRHAKTLRRAANRWYVDADRQAGAALLFFPDVLAFHKSESCRFCAADAVCDGFFKEWLQQPGWPGLTPLDA